MKINIRKATSKDFPEIHAMIHSLATFEKAPEKHTNTVEQMEQEQEYFKAFIAEDEQGVVVGMALYFIAYFTWVGKSLYLDDLYVKSEYRGKGVGKLLIDKIFDVAKKENCKRLRWQVLDWNKPAIDFYDKLGADLDGEWINCDFSEKEIKEYKN